MVRLSLTVAVYSPPLEFFLLGFVICTHCCDDALGGEGVLVIMIAVNK